ncbi:MAG: signal peptidase II [Gammaproteobacteria bacterium]
MTATARAARGWFALAVTLLVIDQATKFLAENWLTYNRPIPVLPSLNLTLLYNRGAAFSFLAGQDGWQRWLFSALAIGVSLYLAALLRNPAPAPRAYRAGLALILGGAIGNLVDRVRLGHVVDFIQVYHDNWFFPAFNVADSGITVGAGLLILCTLRGTWPDAAA